MNWRIEYESREKPTDGNWREREPTGLAWGRCDCGFKVEGPGGAPLPKAEVKTAMGEHVETHGIDIPEGT